MYRNEAHGSLPPCRHQWGRLSRPLPGLPPSCLSGMEPCSEHCSLLLSSPKVTAGDEATAALSSLPLSRGQTGSRGQDDHPGTACREQGLGTTLHS
jgi:hypothetical protein